MNEIKKIMLNHLKIVPKIPWIARITWLVMMIIALVFSKIWHIANTQFFALCAVVAVYACVVGMAFGVRQRIGTQGVFWAFVVDLLAWSSFVYFSGGASNPLITLFLTVVGVGVLVLSVWQSVYLSAISVVLYTLLWFFYQPFANHSHGHHGTMGELHLLGMFGVFIVALLIMTGVTLYFKHAMQRTFNALEQATKTLHQQQKLLAVSSLAANIAHEMSTPIASMQLLTDNIANELDEDDELQDDIALLKSQILTCRQSLDVLKNQIKASQNSNFEPNNQQFCTKIHEILPKVVKDWQFLHPHIVVNLPRIDNFLLKIDEEQLYAILINVFNNAVQAGAKRIDIELTEQNNVAKIAIFDNGYGIDDEVLNRLNKQTLISSNGWGLGLMLAKTVLENVGGEIMIQKQTQGTSVVITLVKL